MGREGYLGEFEHLVLLAILRRGGDASGVTIRDEIVQNAQRAVSFGAVYSTLRRLAARDLICGILGEAEPVRGGRAKKFYTLTPDGRQVLHRSQERLRRMSDGLAEDALFRSTA